MSTSEVIEWSASEVILRPAQHSDAPALARLGAQLASQHATYDAQRFAFPQANQAQSAFEQFFAEQLASARAAITVAEQQGELVGYVFVRLEDDSLVDLLNAGAWIHDIYLAEDQRGRGLGPRLLQAALASARQLGSPSIMLSVSPHNTRARAVFEQHGFRLTMQEMRLDL